MILYTHFDQFLQQNVRCAHLRNVHTCEIYTHFRILRTMNVCFQRYVLPAWFNIPDPERERMRRLDENMNDKVILEEGKSTHSSLETSTNHC